MNTDQNINENNPREAYGELPPAQNSAFICAICG
jgi:hypothetical protein